MLSIRCILSIASTLPLLNLANGRVVTRPVSSLYNETSLQPAVQPRELRARSDDPTNFSWVRKLVAVGDSYTAGVGSGKQAGGFLGSDWRCSRYDYAYPQLVRSVIGQTLDDFKFLACSGARSSQIFDQVPNMDADTDMVIMTAGGNDLCLAAMIKACILLPYNGEDACTTVINKAQENIDTILKPNLKQILLALNDKMAADGIVVFNGYAQMFNTDNEDCANKQNWNYFSRWPKYWFSKPLKLTVARRQRFNSLVVQINQAIDAVVKDVASEVHYKVGFGDWDQWPYKGVKGQMCDPSSDGMYPDPKQPDLQFFKPDSSPPKWLHIDLKRDEELAFDMLPTLELDEKALNKSIYDSILWRSPNPKAEVLHTLDKRSPAPPQCPGDGDWLNSAIGMGLPDSFGKLFHPNEVGHETMASFAIAKAIDLRAEVLGMASQTCELTDTFRCWKKEGRKGYATAYKMNDNKDDFCNSIQQPDGLVGWKYEKTYFGGTPDEHTFKLQLSNDVKDYDKQQCIDSFDRVINSCDGNDPENPLDWKFGGSWKRGEHTYEINVKRDNRPWPPINSTYGTCNGQYYGSHSGYTMYGAGFGSWDWGQQTVLSCMRNCLGSGVTNWQWQYFDAPDANGYEWIATYNTPIWVNARCFANNKVVNCAEGGFTDGCSGTG